MNSDEFDKLTEMRKKWVAVNQKNRFETTHIALFPVCSAKYQE